MRKERISDHIASLNLYSHTGEVDYLVSMETSPEPGEKVQRIFTYRRPNLLYGETTGIIQESDKTFFFVMTGILDNVLYDKSYYYEFSINDDENII